MYPNQRKIRMHIRDSEDSTIINNGAFLNVINDFNGSSSVLTLWIYLHMVDDGPFFSSEFTKLMHCSKNTYYKAFDALRDKGYLVLAKDGWYDFIEGGKG